MIEHSTDEHVTDEQVVDEDVTGEQVEGRRPVETGNPQVDAVLRTLDELPGLPVDEHVAVFEAAHVGLRDALKDARQPAPAHG